MAEEKLEARLEIRLTPELLQILKGEAAARDISVGSLVREALEMRHAISQEDKLEAVKKLGNIETTVKTWDEMKKEIEQGMLKKQ